MKSSIRIGTRGSVLALYQAELVKNLIRKDFPLVQVEIIKIKTSGDMVRHNNVNPSDAGKRLFTKEIEDALLANEIDLAVHSAKDMSAQLPHGLKIGAVLEREDPRDCLISRDWKILSELPLGSRIGTSSPRRKMQLLRWHPELIIEEVHGNVDSRIKKLKEGAYDGLVLALAGIRRLGLTEYVTEIFPEAEFYPAPGQGIIAIESRFGDSETDEIFHPLNHTATASLLECERAFLAQLEGGCQLPCGISTSIEGPVLKVSGAIFALEGHDRAEASIEGLTAFAADVGRDLAMAVLANGGQQILEKIKRKETP